MGGPELLIPIMAILWPMLALIVFIYLFFTTRTKVRMALIESGRDASIFNESGLKTVNRLRTLKQGVICLMGGFGLLLGGFLDSIRLLPPPIAYVSAVLLFIGSGLIVYYRYVSKQPLEEVNDTLMETL